VTNWVLLVSCFGLLAGGSAARQAAAPTRFEEEIRKFQEADRAAPPQPGGVLFTGSSSIKLWETLASDFPGVRTINRGFGGSEIEDAIAHVDTLVLRHRPSQVVFYSGDNDLNEGKDPARVAADYKRFVDAVHARLPATRVVIISVKPSPDRWGIVDKVRTTNRLVQEMVAKDRKRLAFVDVFTRMLRGDGKPRPELYLADGLHMAPAGYAIWKAAVMPVLLQGANLSLPKELPEAE
jgi:lysophospholipase L1-like esterase